MNQFILGATAVASIIASLFFLRYWRDTKDRFFLFFAAAFGIEGLNRSVLGLTSISESAGEFIYAVRLLSFLIILVAIVDKNRQKKQ